MPPEYVDALVETAADSISFDGLQVDYDGDTYRFRTPETTHSDLSESELRDITTGSAHATNWYFWHAIAPQKDDRWAFLRLLEGDNSTISERYDTLADGITTEWGQLHIEITLGDRGRRQYHLCHIEDAGVDDLDRYDDPREARGLAKKDNDGRYRPLKTAPTLQTGWEFRSLEPAELIAAVDWFYPATVTNWHREQEGNLDISHWHETVQRQTGIYGVIKTWDRGEGHEHAEWVAETHCEDTQCLKRREWGYDEETALAVDGGDGVFPCREPCSLVISAARKYTRLDAEKDQTYEFDLTPSEKAQIEEIIDAVADGRIDDIREADIRNAANRYRARFLRAKRFDDDGQLCGVPTEAEE